MELTPLLFYLGAMILRQAKCNFCSAEAISLVESFMSKLPKTELYDSKLYTPTNNNFWRLQGVVFSLQQNCSRSTLMCFGKELNVLVQETDQMDPKDELGLLKRLIDLSRISTDKVHACPQCEVYKEEKPETFLRTLLEMLQKICSKNTPASKSESNRYTGPTHS